MNNIKVLSQMTRPDVYHNLLDENVLSSYPRITVLENYYYYSVVLETANAAR